ncbi:MAG TPA: CRISPR-associated protein Csx19 [Methylococcales bacterium]
MITLYGQRTSSTITLSEALTKVHSTLLPGGVALLYSPEHCQFACLDGSGNLLNQEGNRIDLNPVFEARVFNKKAEMRWLNDCYGKGYAVLLSEEAISQYFEEAVELTKLAKLDEPTTNYILWGQGAKNSYPDKPGWSKLSLARIGSMDVPIGNVGESKRVCLKAIEYLQEVDDYGNVAIVEERLMELEVLK